MSNCATCGAPATTRCSGCKRVYYCNQQCQRKHWKAHKKQCKFTRKYGITPVSDKSNMQQFLLLSTKLNETTPSIIDSYVSDSDCDSNDCQCLKRIVVILGEYQTYLHQDDNHRANLEVLLFGNEYRHIDLVNDFNHLLTIESNHKFQEIYDILSPNNNNVCELCDCLPMRRNQLQRQSSFMDNYQIHQLYFNDNIILQQTLDRIHCYYYHTFDIGHALTDTAKRAISQHDIKQYNCFDATMSTINSEIQNKHDRCRKMKQFERLNNCNKSNSKLSTMYAYSYGKRFFYWTHYKDNYNESDPAQSRYLGSCFNKPVANFDRKQNASKLAEWYIHNKYPDLKDELLSNDICTISAWEWAQLFATATIHRQSGIGRAITCARNKTAFCYDMERGASITVNHLVSLMVYCNLDDLQSKFTATFRYKDVYETDAQLKERHSNCYWLGRLLRECTECFGSQCPPNSLRLYHGVSGPVPFSSLRASIKGPLRTTTKYEVAQFFGGVRGIVLEIGITVDEWRFEWDGGDDAFNRISCFDCFWVSNYVSEREILFIGGPAKFNFEALYIPQTCANYRQYFKGLKQLTYCMSNGDTPLCEDIPSTKSEALMVLRLLQHRLFTNCPDHISSHEFTKCPDFFRNIVNAHCNNIKLIQFRNRNETEFKLHENLFKLFKYDNDWVKVELLCALFPNLEYIYYSAEDKDLSFLKEFIIYDSIKKAMQSKTKLEQVVINFADKFAVEMREFVRTRYKAEFGAQTSCSVFVTSIATKFDDGEKRGTLVFTNRTNDSNYRTMTVPQSYVVVDPQVQTQASVTSIDEDDKKQIHDIVLTFSEPQHIHIAFNDYNKRLPLSPIVNVNESYDANNITEDELANIIDSVEMDVRIEAMLQQISHFNKFVNQTEGIIQCSSNRTDPDYNAAFGCNKGGSTNSSHRRSASQNDRNNGNFDDNKQNDDKDEMKYDPEETHHPSSRDCNHLRECPSFQGRECAECTTIFTRKCEHIKLLTTIFDSLTNKTSHDLYPSYRAKKNIKLSRKMTENILPTVINQPILNGYAFMEKSIGMQYNDGQIDCNPHAKCQIIDCDFYDKKNYNPFYDKVPLYCIMKRTPYASNYKWEIQDQLYTASEATGIAGSPLPRSSRFQLQRMSARYDIIQFTFDSNSIRQIIKQCKWNTIPVFKRKENKQRLTLAMIQEQLNPMITRTMSSIKNDTRCLIPILMFDNTSNTHWIEYILVVHIQDSIDIGISLRYTKRHLVQITGIHLDKVMIMEQHEVLLSHSQLQDKYECRCLNGFTSIINDMCVGNCDALLNEMKSYKQKYGVFKQLAHKFINGKATEKYEILQRDAETAVKRDNGSYSPPSANSIGYGLQSPDTSLSSNSKN